MHINPYLFFNGDCEAAFKRYAQVLNGTIEAMDTWGKSPACDEVPADWQDKVIHVQMRLGDRVLMGSDSPPSYYQKPQGLAVAVDVETPEQAETVFNALAEGGTISMPLEKTFWAKAFGMVTDQFGTPWMVHCE